MLKIKHHILYKKDFKKLVKNGFDDSILNEVILTLRKKEPLPPQFKDHALRGVWKPYRECHIKADVLLVYLVKDDELILLRLAVIASCFINYP
ncbi:type II toxin-antitoxin system mRNA interferase toxin, RelE/StbE family [Helicobacter pylori]|uniref:Addiction module toxin RelE n=1 Tax=Helicobacter pylori UM037 TaxID=1321939 RepID=A0AB33Z4R6_HELPX|nr:type II toxin-antitoxin system mRNA interferase toxin, RelE/StbE family [Helicobacter pylori]EQK94106.1 addiction module toxin RelE [Helicobacter pylori UM037]KNE05300.1 addiction module toxin RelE [Helicobacter pylori]WQS78420.1 type II toxin-antitoxin system mRNA interferase toxin, RelE/StbE family [Helicobacter pylori]WRA50371.1 type II toxin-antitoxin system mRNA interferase toxin, RelE/StbE family [Helicobacter pylori]WRE48420.1 type II toxin-antitoxin system mRNA interferase toxin, Re